MGTREERFQFTQANPTDSTAHTMASEIATYPNGRETNNMAGTKSKATTKYATVVVYPAPVGFCCAVSMATPDLEGWPKDRSGSPDLVQTIREWAEALRHLLVSVKFS
jgi:hypothetical protein